MYIYIFLSFCRITLSEDINLMCSKAIHNLGFLNRNWSEFNNPNCLILLYLSLVRSILEFGSVVWNLTQVGLKNKLEKTQRQFFPMVAHKINLVYKPIKEVAIKCQIPTLESDD